MAKIIWGEEELETTDASGDDIEPILQELNKIAVPDPFVADVTVDNGDTISIALGQESSVLSFTAGNKKPPYHASEGRQRESESGAVRFDYFGSATYFHKWQEIPTDLAIEAVRIFASTGSLPNNVTWAEV